MDTTNDTLVAVWPILGKKASASDVHCTNQETEASREAHPHVAFVSEELKVEYEEWQPNTGKLLINVSGVPGTCALISAQVPSDYYFLNQCAVGTGSIVFGDIVSVPVTIGEQSITSICLRFEHCEP